ncbi:hypothetical protein BDB00DRAFT_874596 [Zychaea mexicana]|uniref:uncharacterized protein n=1 Tax=Zychaea mexicana TaxID=64656 RepID=UPI0022FF2B7F|nr:uncharacterized protein BDB00DRAFT_874596 [Zychaea mexicana]KAI9491208.1 hypothetical protein BDB00DRAFT_874596 [Zychaea mexicana]
MIGFVTKNADQLAYLSTSTSITMPQGYFNHWKNQFAMATIEILQENMDKASTRVEIIDTLQSSHVQGLEAIQSASKQAGKRVRRILDSESGYNSGGEVDNDKEDEDEKHTSTYNELDDVDKLIKSFLRYVLISSILNLIV